MHSVVTSNDLALAIAIPLDRGQFEARLRDTELYDYPASVARRYPGLSREGLWGLVEPTVKVCAYVATEVERLGVRVERRLRCADLGTVMRDARVVTLVAHWRFVPFTSSEIIDPRNIVAELRSGEDRLAAKLRDIAGLSIEELRSYEDNALKPKLADAFNALTSRGHEHYSESSRLVPVTDADALDYVTRADIEARFAKYVAASSAIELSDGLRSIGEFVSKIPSDFCGVLDLTLCNSAVLGNAIKANRPEVTVVMNRFAASARSRLILYLATVRELKRRPSLYGEASVNVRKVATSMTK